jgi:hypothetical protein
VQEFPLYILQDPGWSKEKPWQIRKAAALFTGHQLGAATAAFGASYFKSGFDTYVP